MIYPRHRMSGHQLRAPQGHILRMFRQHEWPSFEHQNAATAACIGDKEMFCDHTAKRATANDNSIKIARTTTTVCAALSFASLRCCRENAQVIQRKMWWTQKSAMAP